MACRSIQRETVLLGFEDEPISDAHLSTVGYWTNKIGGLPNWPVDAVPVIRCPLCSLAQLMVTQIYAPLDSSPYHRTLYVFCCINPNCWNLSRSWTCYRSQILDEKAPKKETETSPTVQVNNWCDGADDWGDGDDNGNLLFSTTDSDDSSSLTSSFSALTVDQCNANMAQRGFGAVGKMSPTAELEGEEGEVVSIDSPMALQTDLTALLEETAPLPQFNTSTFFSPSFMWVTEEAAGPELERECKMLQEYVQLHGEIARSITLSASADSAEEDEKYEKAVPLHGDAMFHEFVTTLQRTPGQLLRYSRGSQPLLISPLDAPTECQHCHGSLVFELQLLPTILTKLKLPGENESHVDFGNVVIFTCKESCWQDGDSMRVEVVCVQAETINPSK